MAKRKLLAGLLASALFLSCFSPTGTVMAAETEMEVEVEPKSETPEVSEVEVDKDESLKATEAGANGFVIEDGVLTDYTGPGGAVVIPDGVTGIGGSAFCNCSKLISITIPESVKSIGDEAFGECSKLTSITIPGSVKSIGNAAFLNCGDSLTIFCEKGSYAEKYAKNNNIEYKYIGQNGKSDPKVGTVLTSGKESYRVTKEGAAVAFIKTTSKDATVTIPATVKIDNVTYKVTSVASNAFKNNKKLTKVTIGKNVAFIGNTAFSGCTN